MPVNFYDEPYLPLECAILIARALSPKNEYLKHRYINHTDAILKDIGREYPARAQIFREKLEPLYTISDYIMANLSVPEKTLRFYFAPPEGCQLVPGIVLAQLGRQNIDVALLPADKKQEILSAFIQSVFEAGLFGSSDCPKNADELTDWLDNQPLCAEDKWTAMQLYHHAERYQAELREILVQAESLYKDKAALWQPILKKQSDELQEKIKNFKNIKEFFKSTYHIEPDSDSMNIYPSLSAFNALTLSNFGLEGVWESTADHYDIGFLMDYMLALDKQSSETSEQLSSRLKAIADKRRLEILTALQNGPLCGQDLAERLGLTPATVSHHMNELVSNGLVDISRDGARFNYSCSRDGIEGLLRDMRLSLCKNIN